jgi:DNA-directed RNA polymerase specialized sigma54-like protein
VNKTSLESTAQDDDFQEVKRCKRHVSNDTSKMTMKSTKSVLISTTVKQTPTAVPICNFFAPLRTNDMGMETIGTEKTLPEQEAHRKSGRPPAIVTTSTTNLIRLQSDLKEHVKENYEFRNTQNRTRIITKEMVDYLAMKSYLEKNNFQYFTFSPNSEKTIKAVIRHLPHTRQWKIFPMALRA